MNHKGDETNLKQSNGKIGEQNYKNYSIISLSIHDESKSVTFGVFYYKKGRND